MASPYAALEDRFRRLSDIEGALSILSWDQAVCMPKGGSETRGNQMATLRRLAHDALTAAETGALLDEAAGEPGLDGWQAANLREMRRRYVRATALDPALVEALTRATNACEMTWRDAKAASDFARLRPLLEEVVRLVREAAGQVGAKLGLSPYDALLDENQPGLRNADVERLFGPLRAVLPGMVEQAIGRQGDPVLPSGPFAVEKQRALGRRLVERAGFDFAHGRLDESAHPFCGGVPQDIRMTTRYREDEVASALMGILHETGHALYEAGLPKRWLGQPVGEARGIAVHESQSLLMEMQACRSPEFVRWLAGEFRATFGDDPAFDPDNLVRLYNRVERSLIRVEADEMTYPLHIVLRWQLEQAMVAGDLAVADLPGAWNDGMRALVGIVPPDDRSGCLQDIHWPVGGFGYFPSYTLGGMLAAQLFQAAERELPELRGAIARGDLTLLLGWVRDRVHAQGSQPTWTDLIVQATGAPLSPEPFLAHLRARYLGG
ncbi:MAG: carboxypeptidase M32 [Geminicoccaceae bacterium]